MSAIILHKDEKRITCGFGSVFRLAIDEPHDPVANPEGNSFTDFFNGYDVVLQMRGHDLDRAFSIEGVCASQCVIEHTADSVEIDTMVDGYALELFRAHEVDGAKNAIGLIDGLE